jgi:hydroxymethylglutaryl-CoA lyase
VRGKILGYDESVWYRPFRDEMPIEIALQTTGRLMERGCDIVRVADGLGDVTPDKVYEYFSRVLDRYPDSNRHALHLHDHRGFGLASYVAAMQAGCSRFDACLRGIGGSTAAIVGGGHAYRKACDVICKNLKRRCKEWMRRER